VSLIGSGNLIHDNAGCPGEHLVASAGDPQLGTLQLNAPGNTPTMAIGATSAAGGNADPATSLLTDQRGVDRPQGGLPDIGAYELCPEPPRGGALICETLVIGPEPTTLPLVMQSSLSAAGTTLPAPGSHDVPENSVIVVSAIPNDGGVFLNWSGNVADPNSPITTVAMNALQNVVANFAAWGADLKGLGIPGPKPKDDKEKVRQPHVELNWTLPSVAVAQFVVLRANTSGGPFTTVGSSTTSAFTDETAGLVRGGSYSYLVRALDAAGLVIGQSNRTIVTVLGKP
jgi:hypothetical protein